MPSVSFPLALAGEIAGKQDAYPTALIATGLGWLRILNRPSAAGLCAGLADGRHGILGHLHIETRNTLIEFGLQVINR